MTPQQVVAPAEYLSLAFLAEREAEHHLKYKRRPNAPTAADLAPPPPSTLRALSRRRQSFRR